MEKGICLSAFQPNKFKRESAQTNLNFPNYFQKFLWGINLYCLSVHLNSHKIATILPTYSIAFTCPTTLPILYVIIFSFHYTKTVVIKYILALIMIPKMQEIIKYIHQVNLILQNTLKYICKHYLVMLGLHNLQCVFGI